MGVITKKGLETSKPLFSLSQDVISVYYLFLWEAQNLDLPAEEFLHLFPSLVFEAHLNFFAFTMFPLLSAQIFIILPLKINFRHLSTETLVFFISVSLFVKKS